MTQSNDTSAPATAGESWEKRKRLSDSGPDNWAIYRGRSRQAVAAHCSEADADRILAALNARPDAGEMEAKAAKWDALNERIAVAVCLPGTENEYVGLVEPHHGEFLSEEDIVDILLEALPRPALKEQRQ